ncbi:histone-lysine N-methyltransferase [Acrasis kona]|uniref:Histone-lysine N-methyltransferase n=1 Tax=Acrasis kona TaxID=1008807 RepID=A0AAW2YWH1_9EUKA
MLITPEEHRSSAETLRPAYGTENAKIESNPFVLDNESHDEEPQVSTAEEESEDEVANTSKTSRINKRVKRETICSLNAGALYHNHNNMSSLFRAKVQIKPARKTSKYFISYFPPKLYCSPYKYDMLITLPQAVFKSYRLAFRLLDGETNQQILLNTKSETSILIEKSKTIRKSNQPGYLNASYRFCFNVCSFHNFRRPFFLTTHLIRLKENEEEEIDEQEHEDANEENTYDHHDERNICVEPDSADCTCVHESELFHIFARKTGKGAEVWGEVNNLRSQLKAEEKVQVTPKKVRALLKRSPVSKQRVEPSYKRIKRMKDISDAGASLEDQSNLSVVQSLPQEQPQPITKELESSQPTRPAQQQQHGSQLLPEQSPSTASLLSPTTPSMLSFPSNILEYNTVPQTMPNLYIPSNKTDVQNLYNQLCGATTQVIPSTGADYFSKCVLDEFFNNNANNL